MLRCAVGKKSILDKLDVKKLMQEFVLRKDKSSVTVWEIF